MRKIWTYCFNGMGMIILIALIAFGGLQYRQAKLAENLSEKIIRFHVKANSDSRQDQELKLKVRDAVGSYMKEELKGVSDLEESRQVLLRDMENVKERARQVIKENGYAYDVSVCLSYVDFPEKSYGDYTFPAGEYEALQVVIGRGQGKNWWCVMYPNMCFRGSVYEVVDEEAEDSLRQVLTAEEYDAVMKSKDYEIQFRWLSFLKTLWE
ncbi:MAG: stage II sporulation protein R [Lachnospiraceae bacterium]|jgi:stage II sporulation protein R|nr:stage II sporulation protein R [Lachnospiraceae bacterium]